MQHLLLVADNYSSKKITVTQWSLDSKSLQGQAFTS